MTDTLQAIGRQLGNDVQALASVSRNVANAQTPGYRAERSVGDFAQQAGLRTRVDERDGSLQQTTRPLDLALRGPGFFAAQRGEQTVLVRGGAFRIDADGRLANAAGDVVLGASGPIAIDARQITTATPLRVDADGQLWVGSQALDQLRIVAVAEPERLQAVGDGAYRYEGALDDWRGSLVQGALESANVQPADEMLRLMELTRHVESVRRAMSTYDQMLDTGINRIGEN